VVGKAAALRQRELRRDSPAQLLYSQAGYPDAIIDTTVTRAPEFVEVAFGITEGEPVRITELTVTGTEGIVPPERLTRRLPLQVGDPFNRLLLGASTDTIRLAVQDRGYPFVDVFRRSARRPVPLGDDRLDVC
jgi:outer membrane protein assembly factor BamA